MKPAAGRKAAPAAPAGSGGPAAPDPDEGRPFEELLDEAETLAARLESRDLPLEEALDAYADGVRKLKACGARLAAVEERARILVADGKGWRLEALDGDDEDSEETDPDAEEDEDDDLD